MGAAAVCTLWGIAASGRCEGPGPVLCHDLAIDHAWEQGLTLPIIDTGVTE